MFLLPYRLYSTITQSKGNDFVVLTRNYLVFFVQDGKKKIIHNGFLEKLISKSVLEPLSSAFSDFSLAVSA